MMRAQGYRVLWKLDLAWACRLVACVHGLLFVVYILLIAFDVVKLQHRHITPITKTFGAWVPRTNHTAPPAPVAELKCAVASPQDSRSADYYIQPVTLAFGEVDSRWVSVWFHFLSCVFQLGSAYDDAAYYRVLDEGRTHLGHFVEYSVSASLMMLAIGVQLGVTDLFTLTGALCNTWACMVFGLFAELFFQSPQRPFVTLGSAQLPAHWLAHAAGWVTLAFAMASMYSTLGMAVDCVPGVAIPGFVWAIIVIESILFCAFGAVQVVAFVAKARYPAQQLVWAARVEAAYIVLSVCAKTILGMLIFFSSS